MVAHDISLSDEALRIKDELEDYFVETTALCPYGLPFKAVYHQALFDTMPDVLMGTYLGAGYRRNGNAIYNMHCPECRACVPIRIIPEEFRSNRNQKRTWKRNQDVSVGLGPLSCSHENLALLEKFLGGRYPGQESTPLDYYNGFFINHITRTVEITYRIGARLIGVSVVDISTDWLNVVFFYFDPEEAQRSPGTFNILNIIDFCFHREIKVIYLGYWIKSVRQMNYKANFKPHYLLQDGRWQYTG